MILRNALRDRMELHSLAEAFSTFGIVAKMLRMQPCEHSVELAPKSGVAKRDSQSAPIIKRHSLVSMKAWTRSYQAPARLRGPVPVQVQVCSARAAAHILHALAAPFSAQHPASSIVCCPPRIGFICVIDISGLEVPTLNWHCLGWTCVRDLLCEHHLRSIRIDI